MFFDKEIQNLIPCNQSMRARSKVSNLPYWNRNMKIFCCVAMGLVVAAGGVALPHFPLLEPKAQCWNGNAFLDRKIPEP
jgi:hypothetical protein